ncbi:MAG: malto-oligosyltrehalose synthase [Nocardiaceae bacterium]|nr:malto-oligosyltrehalose synthase [Nocardiaceae bacterium]
MHPLASTYRLQLRPDAFRFSAAESIIDYLAALGISHAYLSPLLTAVKGSLHGYDVTDPTTVSADLGGEGGLRSLAHAAHSRRMGLIADIVPNHLGVGHPEQNAWWWDVLLYGRDSAHAHFFDIDWSAGLSLPVLESPADLDDLAIDESGDEPLLALRAMRFPIRPGTRPGTPREVHDRQAYRLVEWRTAPSTYRRFLTVNELAALRQEDPDVFDETHRVIGKLISEGVIDGVRVDHPDGLADPAQYFAWLRDLVGSGWIVAEKVLGEHEPLDRTWPIDGTTGYEAMSRICGVFVDPSGESALTAAAAPTASIESLKRAIVAESLSGEIDRLARCIAPQPSAELRLAIIEAAVAMPVGRADTAPNEGILARTLGRFEGPGVDALVEGLARGGEVLSRFGQLCVSIGAKAVEDRHLYQDTRLISLNEVGSDPAKFGFTPAEFHLANADRSRFRPRSMTTLSTHDTKRGEDVRARISVLSQVPLRWAEEVARWENSTPSPDLAIGQFLWQTLFGIWPLSGLPDADRVHKYAEKAIRENATRTSWNAVDFEFEALVHEWIDRVLLGPTADSITAFVVEIAPHAWANSLGQKVLQLCGPGVPDVYQGTELWEDSLVDPDNRRLVNYAKRRAMLEGLDGFDSPPPVDGTGAAKLWVTSRCLRLRQERPESFVDGGYWPVYASGPSAAHVVGFARGAIEPDVVALATRFTARFTGWESTHLNVPAGTWTDRVTGTEHTGPIDAAAVLSRYPVAVLVRD